MSLLQAADYVPLNLKLSMVSDLLHLFLLIRELILREVVGLRGATDALGVLLEGVHHVLDAYAR